MDAVEAKRLFSRKSCAAMLTNLYNKLGTPKSVRLCITADGALGCMPQAAKRLKELLKEKEEITISLSGPIFFSFEWITNVHEIFNATLMNTSLLIKSQNIDK